MSLSRRPSRVLILAILVLCVAWCVQAADAQVRVLVPPPSGVSWGGPSAEFPDEIAAAPIPPVAMARLPRGHEAPPLLPSGRVGVAPESGPGEAVALASRLTRAPPIG
jgi:hypothetical protein